MGPFIIPALGYGAAALGIGTGAAAVTNPDMFFGSIRERAKREYDEGRYDPETQKRSQSFGDVLGDAFTGSKALIDEEIKQEHIRRLKKDYGPTLEKLKGLRGFDVPKLGFDTTRDALDITLSGKLAALQDQRDALRIAANRGVDVSDRTKYVTADDIRSAVAADIEREDRDATIPGSTAYLAQRDQNRDIENQRQFNVSYNQRAQSQRDSTNIAMAQLQATIANQQNQFNLAQANQMFQNRRLDREDARDRRDEKQAMIMMLIRGLTQGVGSLA